MMMVLMLHDTIFVSSHLQFCTQRTQVIVVGSMNMNWIQLLKSNSHVLLFIEQIGYGEIKDFEDFQNFVESTK